jgi:hypothetical protein
MLRSWWERPVSLATKFNSRGRSAVLWAVALFVALQAAFYYPLAHVWPQLLDAEYGEKLTHLRAQLAAKVKDQPCVVALGSSLTGWAFNPSDLTSVKPGSADGPVVFNFAINSGGVIVELLCLRRLLDDGIRPDLLVLETHPQYLFRAYNTVPGKHYLQVPRFQFRDAAVLNRYDPEWRDLRHEWRAMQWFPWFNRRHDLQNYLIPHWVRRRERTDVWTFTDRNGWEYIPSAIAYAEAQPREAGVQSILHRIHCLNNSPMEEGFKQAYREIIDLCKAHGVPVVMVRMPEVSYALRHYTPDLKKRVDAFYASLIRDTGIPYVDAKEWVVDSDFTDAFHLYPRGATVFMRRLEREFLREWLQRRAGSAGMVAGR